MKIKEVYVNNKNRRVCAIERIEKENVEMQSKPLEIIKENKLKFFLGTIIIFLILLLTFYNNLQTLGIVCAFVAFMVVSSIVINTYSLKCNKDSLHMELNLFQKFDLPYNKIVNIYLGKELSSTNFIPKMNYALTIRYLDNFNFMKELSLPALFLKAEQVDSFLKNFILIEEKDEGCIKYEKYKSAKNLLKILAFVVFVIILGFVAIFSLKK